RRGDGRDVVATPGLRPLLPPGLGPPAPLRPGAGDRTDAGPPAGRLGMAPGDQRRARAVPPRPSHGPPAPPEPRHLAARSLRAGGVPARDARRALGRAGGDRRRGGRGPRRPPFDAPDRRDPMIRIGRLGTLLGTLESDTHEQVDPRGYEAG